MSKGHFLPQDALHAPSVSNDPMHVQEVPFEATTKIHFGKSIQILELPKPLGINEVKKCFIAAYPLYYTRRKEPPFLFSSSIFP